MWLGIQPRTCTGCSGNALDHRRARALALGPSDQDTDERPVGSAREVEEVSGTLEVPGRIGRRTRVPAHAALPVGEGVEPAQRVALVQGVSANPGASGGPLF